MVRVARGLLLLALAAVLVPGCDEKLGIGAAPRIRVLPTSHAFESVAVGDAEPVTISVTNIGGGTLTVSNVELTPSSSADFSLESLPGFPRRLGPNQGFSFDAIYRPSDVGADSGRVVITSNDGASPTVNVNLSTLDIGPRIVVDPNVLDFGVVERGTTQTLTAKIKNEGFAELVIQNIVAPAGSDFGIVEPTSMPSLAPSGETDLTVSYSPSGCSASQGAVENFSNDGTASPYLVTVKGRPPGPAIAADPSTVTFAGVTVGTPATQVVHLKNVGTIDLHVSSIFLGIGTSPSFTLQAPATPLTIAPGATADVTVGFQTSTAGGAHGVLVASSDDCDHAQLQIPLDAVGTDGPQPLIQITPSTVSFGNVPSGGNLTKTFTVSSVGSAPLSVSGIALAAGTTPEFSVVGPTTISLGACTGPPCPSQVVSVKYAPTAAGGDNGELIVTSNAANDPNARVALTANGTAGVTCELDVSPGILNFRSVAVGQHLDMPITLKNNGSGNCTYQGTDLAPLTGIQGFIVQAQPGLGSVIGPGATKQVVMRLAPTSLGPKNGACGVKWDDPNPGGAGPGQSALVLLTGFSVEPTIEVIPGHVDFGLVTVGCASQIITVTVYNTGSGDLTLNSIHLASSPSRFQIIQAPPPGTNITGGASVDVKLRYVPTATGTTNDTLVIESNDQTTPTKNVPLTGQGTNVVDVIDKFLQAVHPKVDMLFVIDNSGSMDNKQDNLRANIQSISNIATSLAADYQMGVITTDSGSLHGNPKIIRPTDANPAGEFQANANVGTNGSGTEEGLEFAYRALSDPLVNGDNAGFLRQDASLEVVVLSDEEDQSPQTVDFYVNFFLTVKGVRNANLFRFSAIVGDSPNGCTANGGAEAAPRYIDVVNRTGGVFGSICDSNYAQTLSAIGSGAFALRVQYFLTRQADPGQPMSVRTYANESACDADPNATGGTVVPVNANTGYTYDAPSNSVIFGPQAVPPRGACIKVKYKALCNAI